MANAISGWKQISQSVLENLQSICISGFQRKSMMLTFGGFEDGCCKEEKHIRNSYLFLSGGYCVEDEYLSAKTIKKKSLSNDFQTITFHSIFHFNFKTHFTNIAIKITNISKYMIKDC